MSKHKIYLKFNNFTKDKVVNKDFTDFVINKIDKEDIDYLIKYLEINKMNLKDHLIKIYTNEWNIYLIGFCRILLFSWNENRDWRALNTLLKLNKLGYLKTGFNELSFTFVDFEKQLFVFKNNF